MFQELTRQVDHLNQEFREGLGAFQSQVSSKMTQGLESLSDRINSYVFMTNSLEEKIQARDFERQKQINYLLTGTKKTVIELEKQVSILRYCLIFLVMCIVAEKLAQFIF